MDINQIKEKLTEYRIIPVIAIDKVEDAIPLADALIAGGLPLIEITFRTAAAKAVMAMIKKERPEILLGAGTILNIDELKMAINNGAAFGVAPGFNPKIAQEAIKNNFPFMPGVMTPTDLEGALSLGNRILKFFPAEGAGGVKYLSSLSAPYAHRNIQFIPTGGINLLNLKEYLCLNSVIAVGGTWIAKSSDINNCAWDTVTTNCLEIKKIIKGL